MPQQRQQPHYSHRLQRRMAEPDGPTTDRNPLPHTSTQSLPSTHPSPGHHISITSIAAPASAPRRPPAAASERAQKRRAKAGLTRDVGALCVGFDSLSDSGPEGQDKASHTPAHVPPHDCPKRPAASFACPSAQGWLQELRVGLICCRFGRDDPAPTTREGSHRMRVRRSRIPPPHWD